MSHDREQIETRSVGAPVRIARRPDSRRGHARARPAPGAGGRLAARLAPGTGGLLVVLIPALAFAALQLRYDREYPAIAYTGGTPTDRVTRLQDRIDRGEIRLQFDAKSGYLASLLAALDIETDSQMLVFSKTSRQTRWISPRKPRAIYYNDDAYVAWVQGGDFVEIASVDPNLGAVFHTLSQKNDVVPLFERQTVMCLECHDSYSLSGGGVPRFMVGSGLVDSFGELASHESWRLTSDQSPLARRWGGWYVTGTHGDQRHMGNLIIRDLDRVRDLDLSATGNVTDLSNLVDTDPYLGDTSDIVSLLVLEHQTHVQNVIIRASWDARTTLYEQREQNRRSGRAESFVSAQTAARMEAIAEPVVRALLLVGEAPLEGAVAGTSGFAERFADLGPADDRGRSLRRLDLATRLFRYPCSFLIYSDVFDALPAATKGHVFRRLHEVLAGEDRSEPFAHLSAGDRSAILEILEATKLDFAASEVR